MSNPLPEWNIHNASRTHIDLYELRMFGHEAFVLDETHKKNDPKAFRCIYLGPSRDHKGSTFYNLHTQRIITSRNYIINEQHKPGLELYPKFYDKYLGPPTQPKFSTDSISHWHKRWGPYKNRAVDWNACNPTGHRTVSWSPVSQQTEYLKKDPYTWQHTTCQFGLSQFPDVLRTAIVLARLLLCRKVDKTDYYF